MPTGQNEAAAAAAQATSAAQAVTIESFLAELAAFQTAASESLGGVSDGSGLEQARIDFLGARSGRLKAIQKLLSGLASADRPAGGRHFNEAKGAVTALFAALQDRLAVVGAGAAAVADAIDVTLPGELVRLGHVHPITQTIRRVQEIMARLGFESVDGPEVEDQWHNFEALAIPAEHPARDPLDNFYLAVARWAADWSARCHPDKATQIKLFGPNRFQSFPSTAFSSHQQGFNHAEAEDPQRRQEAFPSHRPWEGEAPPCRNEPLAGAAHQQAEAEAPGHWCARCSGNGEDRRNAPRLQLLRGSSDEAGEAPVTGPSVARCTGRSRRLRPIEPSRDSPGRDLHSRGVR